MKQRLMKFFAAALVLMSFISLIFCMPVSAKESNDDNMIELSNDDYEDYVKNLLRPSFFDEFLSEMTASAVDLNKDSYKSTNVPQKSGAGSAGGNILKDFGKEIIKDLAKDIFDKASVDNSGYQMPEFRQQTGKLRNVYNSGLVEIITCTMTTYQTLTVGNLGGNTGRYDDHCILTFVRQVDDYYTVTTICDDYSKKYCESYTTTGNYTLKSYYPHHTTYYSRFFDYETQATVPYHTVLSTGTLSYFSFYDVSATDEFSNYVCETRICFHTYDKRGISEFSSGAQYRNLYYILAQSFLYNSNSGSSSAVGCVFTASNTITNDYQDYSQLKDHNENTEQKQSITYLSKLNTTDIINQKNISNYNDISNDFDSWYQSNVTEIVNNNVTNVYNNYWITPTDPPETQPPATQSPTDPPTEPASQSPTDSLETIPPVTQPSDSPETFPPAPNETILPEYTLDVSVVSSGMADIKNQAFTVDVSKSFWLFDIMDRLFTELDLLPGFLLLFFISVLGALLWD